MDLILNIKYLKKFVRKYIIVMWSIIYLSLSLNSIYDYIKYYNGTHKLEVNKFINQSNYYPGYRSTSTSTSTSTKSCSMIENNFGRILEPASLDWREKSVVTPVKNQGACGSCWSFSATGALESVWAIYSGSLEELSEQQLIDCSTLYGNNACNGGEMTAAFEYVIDHGICLENDIPYLGKKQNCPDSKCNTIPHFSSCKLLGKANQQQMMRYVQYHPLSVGIQADQPLFKFYKSGVITSKDCGTNVDHGVLVVGYGTENGHDYWLVKNSWGADWGDNGYVKIGRSDSNNDIGICGIASEVSFPVV